MYCSNQTTWATADDLRARYGDEFIDKLGVRRNWDSVIQSYVADVSPESINEVINLALCDAAELLKRKLSCKFTNASIVDTLNFPAIKQWHIKLTIETLKRGGDCMGCECVADIDKFIDCGSLCTDDGQCLISNKTFISVSKAEFCCEMMGKGCCCE